MGKYIKSIQRESKGNGKFLFVLLSIRRETKIIDDYTIESLQMI
jgi:hypothetical protein